MRLDRPLRLPFATGASPVGLALGIGIFGFLGSGPVFFGSVLPNWVIVPCGILIAIWFFALVSLPFTAKRQRASDVLLDASGIEVRGGPFHRRALTWAAIAAKPPALRTASGKNKSEASLALPDGVGAASEDPEEIASLRALGETLDALAKGHAESRSPRKVTDAGAEVAPCPSCGAPLPPTHDATIRCVYCSVDAPVPEALRREVAELRSRVKSRTTTGRALDVLSIWPRAGTVNAVLGVAAVPLVFAWPFSAVVASEFLQYYDIFSWRDVFVLFGSTAAVTLGLVFWLERQIVHRQAFSLVVASFHAVTLDVEGSPLGCHHCGAPIQAKDEGSLVVCAYCRVDNVILGLVLPERTAAEERQALSLDDLLAKRLRSMRTWRVLSIASLALILGGGWLLRDPLTRAATSAAPRHAPIDRAWSYPGPSPQ